MFGADSCLVVTSGRRRFCGVESGLSFGGQARRPPASELSQIRRTVKCGQSIAGIDGFIRVDPVTRASLLDCRYRLLPSFPRAVFILPVFILLGMRMRRVVRFHHEPGRNLGIVRNYVEIVVTKNVRTHGQGASAITKTGQ
jgi:hypothetical protein